MKHDAAFDVGGPTGVPKVDGQPLAVSVPVNLPVLVLYDSARATYRLAALEQVVANAAHVVTAVPDVA